MALYTKDHQVKAHGSQTAIGLLVTRVCASLLWLPYIDYCKVASGVLDGSVVWAVEQMHPSTERVCAT